MSQMYRKLATSPADEDESSRESITESATQLAARPQVDNSQVQTLASMPRQTSTTMLLDLLASQQQSEGPSEEEARRAEQIRELRRQLEGKHDLLKALQAYELVLGYALKTAANTQGKGIKYVAQVEFFDYALDADGEVVKAPHPDRFNDTRDAVYLTFTTGRETHSLWAIINVLNATRAQIAQVQREIAAIEAALEQLDDPERSDETATDELLLLLLGAEE